MVDSNEYVWLETFGEPPAGGFTLHLPDHHQLPSRDGEGFPDQMAGFLEHPIVLVDFLREYPCVWETSPEMVQKLVDEHFGDVYPGAKRRRPKQG